MTIQYKAWAHPKTLQRPRSGQGRALCALAHKTTSQRARFACLTHSPSSFAAISTARFSSSSLSIGWLDLLVARVARAG